MGIYKKEYTREISFPVGGIGTGCIGLGGNGRLMDWEIFNRPNKGSTNGYSHFAVRAVRSDGTVDARILAGDSVKEAAGQYTGQRNSFGFGAREKLSGMPHFTEHTFCGEFPIARIHFRDPHFPGETVLTAFNPLIPRDSYNSSIPAAFYTVTFHNPTDAPIRYSAALSVWNPYYPDGRNERTSLPGMTGVVLYNDGAEEGSPKSGNMAVLTDCAGATAQKYWYFGGWMDSLTTYWNEFSSGAVMQDRDFPTEDEEDDPEAQTICNRKYGPASWTATVCVDLEVAPGATGEARFVLGWYHPVMENDWHTSWNDQHGALPTWKNYYATVFRDAADAASYGLRHFDSLLFRTTQFKDALFSTTLDPAVIDAVSATLSVLKSPTVYRLENGEFYGFEGVDEKVGSCEGTCTHVWNYAYALPFLFPDLERSLRKLEYTYNMTEDGSMQFRLLLPVGRALPEFVMPCVDGQMGGILKVYREWKLSDDDRWLREIWPAVKKSLEYAWSPTSIYGWDRDRDGVLEGRQHHTLDMELFGPSGWLQGFYLAALKAGAELAEHMGEPETAAEYRRLFEQGRAWTEENLFNGRYYQQKVDVKDKSILKKYKAPGLYWNREQQELKYQIDGGCEIDQLCGQWHADILGLGDIFDPDNRAKALQSLWDYNFIPSFRELTNPWRVFARNDESGAIMCTWPEGADCPSIPLPYATESMHGFEYELAGLLLAGGMKAESDRLVHAIRDRYNGENRNPWNEVECGNNYARSMASFALLPLSAGFVFDLPHFKIGFRPRVLPIRTIWNTDPAWGTVDCTETGCEIRIIEGAITLTTIAVPHGVTVTAFEMDGHPVPYTQTDSEIRFDRTVARREMTLTYQPR